MFLFAGLAGVALLNCSSSSNGAAPDTGDDGGGCYPDNDGVNNIVATVDLTVDDTGFSKTVISTQNESPVILTLKNTGTKPHGFAVQCTSVLPAYPNVPAGCPTTSCFPSDSTIAPIAPGASVTINFQTPVADSLVYPFTSNEPDDVGVPGLNNGQWNLM